MKTTLSLILCFITTIALAQEPKNTLGINGTQFIANYLNFGGSVTSNNPYLVLYNREMGKGHLRTGVNLRYQDFDDNRFIQNKADEKNNLINLRVGYALTQPLGERFTLIYGGDLLYGHSVFERKSQQQVWTGSGTEMVTNVSVNSSDSYGGGLVGAIRFNITDRVSLYTESRLYAQYQEIEQGNRWEDVSQELRDQFPNSFPDNVNESFMKNINFFVPLDIFVQFNF